ncbi:MAG: glycerophosphodiester phosphodiesterase [Deltaproteobacteria bacterium]|nr:glycerophosphodiester phosphodiesterase [Deltaproteobacteria bacterium]
MRTRPRAALLGLCLLIGCTGSSLVTDHNLASIYGSKSLDVQGHRGARGLLPENTLPAFSRALALGVTTLELDLGVTSDGIVVVFHDRWISPSLCRLPKKEKGMAPPPPGGKETGGKETGGGERTPLLRDLTLEEVRSYDCGSLNPSKGRFPEPPRRQIPGTQIPTLEEVFLLAAASRDPDIRFNVEIKAHPLETDTVPLPEFVAAVIAQIQKAGVAHRTTVQSFHWRALELAKAAAPEIRTVALLAQETLEGNSGQPSPWLNGLSYDPGRKSLLALLQAAEPYVNDVSPHWRLVTPESGAYLGVSVGELQRAGFAVIPWTVNRSEDMLRILGLGVDGIITDYPDKLLQLLEELGISVQ